ncbi:MAG: signal peptide peptidase SppA [Nitratireductor sp.]|nr:signal peptide peptidase SppA [Nitratireductor sp.]
MAMNADEIIDRRRLRRKLTFWRIGALLVLGALAIALFAASGLAERFGKKGSDHIARVKIEGVITNDRKMLDLFEELGKKQQVKAVILDMSSPGGSTVGGEAMYEAVRKLAEKKPVVTSVGTLAASAGYMIACGSDHIIARRSSIVGSIGVLFQYGDVSGLLDKVGVKVDAIKSAPLKAEPSPFHPASDEAKAMISKVVGDTFEWFVGLVAERRGFDMTKARALADGSVFTGSQGLSNGLVDEIGDEETARKWLVSEKSLSDKLKVIEWKPRADDGYFANPAALITMARLFGINLDSNQAVNLQKALEKRLFLDGLVSMLQIDLSAGGGNINGVFDQ